METKSRKISESNNGNKYSVSKTAKVIITFSFILILAFNGSKVFAHCDSYNGPVVTDALKALEINNVNLLFKWIDRTQEPEIKSLFDKTYKLKSGDKEIYSIIEKHLLETVVRLHRETEGAPFTGLKPAGSTKEIIRISDGAIESGSIENLLLNLNGHIDKVIRQKYIKVTALDKIKNTTSEKGREYVAAYIDYTHTLEALHDIIEPVNDINSVHHH